LGDDKYATRELDDNVEVPSPPLPSHPLPYKFLRLILVFLAVGGGR